MESFTRNKNRFRNQIREPYQPEYIRLNKEPIMYNPGSTKLEEFPIPPKEFPMMPSRRSFVTNSTPKMEVITPNKPAQVNPPPFSAPMVSEQNNVVPGVSSSWANKKVITGAQTNEADLINQETIRYNEVPSPPTKQEEIEDLSPMDIDEDEYCIVVQGQILYKSDSIENIEAALDHIFYKIKTVQYNDVVIFKRMKMKVGVSIS